LQGWSSPGGQSRIEEATGFLLTSQRLGFLFDYSDSRGNVYYDVLIRDVTWDNRAVGERVFKITMEQVQFAQVTFVPTPVISRAASKKAKGPTAADLGTSALGPEDVPAPLVSSLAGATGSRARRSTPTWGGSSETPGPATNDYAYKPWRHLKERPPPTGGAPSGTDYTYSPWRHLQEVP
jgi:hypothetical protein